MTNVGVGREAGSPGSAAHLPSLGDRRPPGTELSRDGKEDQGEAVREEAAAVGAGGCPAVPFPHLSLTKSGEGGRKVRLPGLTAPSGRVRVLRPSAH